jgi:hypothetical protein
MDFIPINKASSLSKISRFRVRVNPKSSPYGLGLTTAYLMGRSHVCRNEQVLRDIEDLHLDLSLGSSGEVEARCDGLMLESRGSSCQLYMEGNSKKNIDEIKAKGPMNLVEMVDLISEGHGCPWAYQGALASSSQVDMIICPYSYIVNPLVRRGLQCANAMIIFDEGKV